MTAAAGGVLGIAAIVAMVDWWTVAVDRRRLEYVFEPATPAALIGVALLLDAGVFLMLPGDTFVAGVRAAGEAGLVLSLA